MGSSAKKSDSGVSPKRSSVTARDSFGASESSSRSLSSSELKMKEKKKGERSLSLSPTILDWPIRQAELQARKSVSSVKSVVSSAKEVENKDELENKEEEELGSKLSEMDIMKERFAKLLLGEDMPGSGKGVCTALAISNAITN